MIEDYYGALGVQRNASKEDIEAAYQARTREWERARDAGDPRAAAELARVKAARDFLADDDKRELYDELSSPVALPPPPVLVPGEDPPPEPEALPEPEKPEVESAEQTARRTRIFFGRVLGVVAMIFGAILIVQGRFYDPSSSAYAYTPRYSSSWNLIETVVPGMTHGKMLGTKAVIEGLFIFLTGLGFLIVPDSFHPF